MIKGLQDFLDVWTLIKGLQDVHCLNLDYGITGFS